MLCVRFFRHAVFYRTAIHRIVFAFSIYEMIMISYMVTNFHWNQVINIPFIISLYVIMFPRRVFMMKTPSFFTLAI